MVSDVQYKRGEILPDLMHLYFPKFKDHRGEIYSTYVERAFDKLELNLPRFVHDKNVFNVHYVLRGIHGDDYTHKMVSVVYGDIIQVCVDFRSDSATYLKYEKFLLSSRDEMHHSVVLPPGFGNAFYVASDFAIYNYKLAYNDNYVDVEGQFTIPFNSKEIGIDWGLINPIISERDQAE